MGSNPPGEPSNLHEPGSGVRQAVAADQDAYTAGRDQYVINFGWQSEASCAQPHGRIIGELGEQDALALEVHQAFEASTASMSGQVPVLPVYLPRPGFDDRLRAAVAGAAHGSRMVVVVGDSSTGKTRACWEAIRAELPDWRIWHPLAPERPLAMAEAVRAGRVAPHTVIWLNEAQFYLQPASGEQVAAEVQALLADPSRGPVLVLGSMWPGFGAALTAVPEDPSAPDPHQAARVLLDQAEYITAPPEFTAVQLASLAATISTDPRLRAAAKQAHSGRITQELAGAPELLRRYEQASPAARAVLWAAMDARRLGHSLLLSESLLRGAAPGYLDDHEWNQVGGTPWYTDALDELTTQHRRLPGPLVEHRPRPGESRPSQRLYRLADYLEQHARTERARLCPPATFWTAAADHAQTPEDLTALGKQAMDRGRYRHADRLYRRAVDAGDTSALLYLIRLRDQAGDHQGLRRLFQQAADAGHADTLMLTARLREEAGDHQDAEWLAQRAADAGRPDTLTTLAWLREMAGDLQDAERLYRQAADAGDTSALTNLAWLREMAGDLQDAERLYRQAADAGDTSALTNLAWLREQAGDLHSAERLYRQASNAGQTDALVDLARVREKAGDYQRAEQLAQQATDAGYPDALIDIAWLRFRAGDLHSAERLYRQASNAGQTDALLHVARLRDRADDHQGAEQFYRQAADAGDTSALSYLAKLREQAGDPDGADQLRRFGLTAAGDVEDPWT
ncbi:tetratricopeptide repeat protein [Actinomadura syzygii]|uniref:tetratricopeptide repeat protein n=1 Tax=Actinomadura syzygii TaxID=1427538 RepID=UPI00165215A4|nr:tetratricopeptide repeat protein [Actinomadura syzygii]